MVTGFDYLSRDEVLQGHWIKRFVAIFIDGLIIWLPIWLLSWLIGVPSIITAGLFGPLLFVYAFVFETAIGGTVGKMLLHLKAVSTTGQMNPSQALFRNLSKFLVPFLLLDWIIGMLVDTKDPRQKWTDQLAKTSVMATDRPGGT